MYFCQEADGPRLYIQLAQSRARLMRPDCAVVSADDVKLPHPSPLPRGKREQGVPVAWIDPLLLRERVDAKRPDEG